MSRPAATLVRSRRWRQRSGGRSTRLCAKPLCPAASAQCLGGGGRRGAQRLRGSHDVWPAHSFFFEGFWKTPPPTRGALGPPPQSESAAGHLRGGALGLLSQSESAAGQLRGRVCVPVHRLARRCVQSLLDHRDSSTPPCSETPPGVFWRGPQRGALGEGFFSKSPRKQMRAPPRRRARPEPVVPRCDHRRKTLGGRSGAQPVRARPSGPAMGGRRGAQPVRARPSGPAISRLRRYCSRRRWC